MGGADRVRVEVLVNMRRLGLAKKRPISYKPGEQGSSPLLLENSIMLIGMERDIYTPWAIRSS